MDEIKYEGSLSELYDQLLDEEEQNITSKSIEKYLSKGVNEGVDDVTEFS